jgi:4-amino-4-deoxy-L-arabinose transferase-like glycosyltransferase
MDGRVTSTVSAATQPRALAPLAVLKGLALVLVAYKVVLLLSAGVFQDEAYYWIWGQHPALSYFDHPPLNAWLQGLAGAIFGWNRFALRIMVALALVADIGLIWMISRRIAWDWPEHFWRTLILFLATPVFFAVTAVALPDHLLVTFGLAAIYFFVSFFQRWPELPRWRDLYLGAFFLGLAALAKYNAAFIGVGLGLYIILAPRARPLLLKPQLYLAAAIAVALQAPVLAWNLQQGMASFSFILGSRHAGLSTAYEGLGSWAAGFLLLVGPFLLIPLLGFAFSRRKGEGLGRAMFWVSTAAILTISLSTTTLFHWNLVAYLAALPFLAFHMRWRWLTWLHIAYGVAFLSFMLVNYSFTPITDVRALRDEATAWAYGWDDTAAAVRAAKAEHGAGFVATADYTTAALLGYAMADKGVTSLNARRDQFDYWFDEAAHAGSDAILLGDTWRPLTAEVMARFEEVVLLEEIPVVRGGTEIDLHQIYLGKGFVAAPK